MAYEKLRSLVERLNVDGVKSVLTVIPSQSYRGAHDIVNVMCFSDNQFYMLSLVKGMQQFFDEKLEIKPEIKPTVGFFKPTKPQQNYYQMTLGKTSLLKLCEKFNVSYDELKEECRNKINENPYKEEIKARQTL